MSFAYFALTHLTLCYVVPLLVIAVSYVLVGHQIWERKILGSHPSDEVERQTRLLQQSKLRALRMVAVVVGAFALAWLPLYATFTRIQLGKVFTEWQLSIDPDSPFWLTHIAITQWMSSANSCVNPFLYHFLDPRFRCRFRQLLFFRSSQRTTISQHMLQSGQATAAAAVPAGIHRQPHHQLGST